MSDEIQTVEEVVTPEQFNEAVTNLESNLNEIKDILEDEIAQETETPVESDDVVVNIEEEPVEEVVSE